MLSHADIRRKAEKNRNPALEAFDAQTDEFYSCVRDTDICHFIPELKRRMLDAIKKDPPLHPDDWGP